MSDTIFIYVLPILIILIGIYLSFWTEILKDTSNNDNKPYSLARSQLMWWTIIISTSFSAFYGYHNTLPEITNSILILLSISLATTTASRIIDNSDVAANKDRHQNKNNSKYFWSNILSDQNGISVHRFQTVIFNIIFGLIFISHFVTTHLFADFTYLQLGLMGVSSAAYLGIKMNENN
jgi:hypothetical protein